MKKLTAIMLTVIMLLSLTSLVACRATTTSIYEKNTEKMLSVDAYEANITMTMDMTAASESITTEMDYVVKADNIKSDSPIGYADIKMKMLGQTVEVVSYSEGDHVYINSMGEGMKLPKDSELAASYDMSGTVAAYNIKIPAEILETTEFTTDADGNYVLDFAFDGKEHADILKDLANSVMSGIDASLSDYDLDIGDVKYVITINKDDYTFKSMKLEMNMNIAVEGMEMAIKTVVDCEYVAYNDSVTITPPEGYQDYEELTA